MVLLLALLLQAAPVPTSTPATAVAPVITPAPMPMPTARTQTKTFLYGRDDAVIFCSRSVVCDLSFAPDDSIMDIVVGHSDHRDQRGWTIARGLEGDRPTLYLSPNVDAEVTNLVVTTPDRTYHATLVATPIPSHPTSYAFLVPDADGIARVVPSPYPSVVYTSAPGRTPAEVPTGPRPTFSGDLGLVPSQAIRYVDRLVLEYLLPYSASAPGLAQLLPDGTTTPVQIERSVTDIGTGIRVTMTIYDLSHPLLVYVGSGKTQRRMEVHP